MSKYWWRSRRRIGEGRHVVRRQHEAVIHIAGADHVLVDLVCNKNPSRSSRGHPIRSNLDRSADKNAFAARQISNIRLSGIIAVQYAHRPAVEVGFAFSLEALNVPGRLIKSRARAESKDPVRRIAEAGDVIRLRGLQTGIDR